MLVWPVMSGRVGVAGDEGWLARVREDKRKQERKQNQSEASFNPSSLRTPVHSARQLSELQPLLLQSCPIIHPSIQLFENNSNTNSHSLTQKNA